MNIDRIIIPIILIALLSCNNRTESSINLRQDSVKQCCGKEGNKNGTEATIPEESIFNIAGSWKKQNGETFQFRDLSGSITVVAMIFTSCPSACPRIIEDIKKIESGLGAGAKSVKFLLITMDPENDTPERLSTFAAEHELNNNWVLVCSGEDATMEIANVLGIRIKKLSGGGFDHSNAIFVLDKSGVINYKQDGLGQDPSETIKSIRAL